MINQRYTLVLSAHFECGEFPFSEHRNNVTHFHRLSSHKSLSRKRKSFFSLSEQNFAQAAKVLAARFNLIWENFPFQFKRELFHLFKHFSFFLRLPFVGRPPKPKSNEMANEEIKSYSYFFIADVFKLHSSCLGGWIGWWAAGEFKRREKNLIKPQ